MICTPLHLPAPKPAVRFRVCKIRCAVAVAAAPAGRLGTLYDVLGLRAGATGREIKAAYRRLARERHPDVAGAPAASDFIRIHDAYATLSDPNSRARYDSDVVALAQRPRSRSRWGAGGSGGSRPRRTWETDQCW